MSLRDYQQEAVDRLFTYWEKKTAPCILQLSTGAGKSHIIAEIVKRNKHSTLVLQPTKEILEQNFEKLVDGGFNRKQIQVCSASAGAWDVGQITLATIGTICKAPDYCQHFKTIIVDECDVVPVDRVESQYVSFFNQLPKARIVGLTATPWRNQSFARQYEDPRVYCRPLTRIFCKGGDQMPCGKWFWKGGVIYKCEIPYLQSRDFLSKTEYFMQETDWSFVRDVPGRVDYDTNEMTRWMDFEANTSRFHQAIDWCIRNNLKAIVFSPNIDMNFRLANIIEAMGGKAETMDSENDARKSRQKKMGDFRADKFQFLVNVGMVGRGVDVPSVDAVILCRPTKSLSLYMQYVGRCLRKDPNNPDKKAYVLDLSGNVERFGKVEDVKLMKKQVQNQWGGTYGQDVITILKDGKRVVWEEVS